MVLAMVTSLQAAFKPPVIVRVVPSEQGRIYFIDRGLDANIKVGGRPECLQANDPCGFTC